MEMCQDVWSRRSWYRLIRDENHCGSSPGDGGRGGDAGAAGYLTVDAPWDVAVENIIWGSTGGQGGKGQPGGSGQTVDFTWTVQHHEWQSYECPGVFEWNCHRHNYDEYIGQTQDGEGIKSCSVDGASDGQNGDDWESESAVRISHQAEEALV